jgi:hypothetical protein
LDDLAGGTGLVEAERVGYDRCRGLQHKLPQGGDTGYLEQNAEAAQPLGGGVSDKDCPAYLPGEQPARLGPGLGGELAKQAGERLGHRHRRVPEPDEQFRPGVDQVGRVIRPPGRNPAFIDAAERDSGLAALPADARCPGSRLAAQPTTR